MNADEKRKKLLETIQGFRLIDDTYFNTFMEDNFEGMGLFLRIILQDPALHVTEIQTQREVSNIYGRSVRFDVFTKSADGTICNTEVRAICTIKNSQNDPSILKLIDMGG